MMTSWEGEKPAPGREGAVLEGDDVERGHQTCILMISW